MRPVFPLTLKKITVLYHIYHNGQRVTDKPVSLEWIKAKCGSVMRLEQNGIRVVRAN